MYLKIFKMRKKKQRQNADCGGRVQELLIR